MKNSLFYLPGSILLAALFLSGCASHGPAFLGNTGTYMAKPIYNGERAGGFYFSGRFNQGHVYYEEEKNRSFDFSSHAAFMWKNFYLAGGFFGYGGKYQIDLDSTERLSLKPFAYNGFGGRFEIGGRVPLERNLDFLFGFSQEWFSQTGPFETQTESDWEEIFGDVFSFGLDGFSVGYNAEVRLTPTPKNAFGLRYTWDSVFRGENDYPLGFMNLTNTQRLTLHATLDRVTAFGQLGFTNTGQQLYSVGLTCGFPFWRKGDSAN